MRKFANEIFFSQQEAWKQINADIETTRIELKNALAVLEKVEGDPAKQKQIQKIKDRIDWCKTNLEKLQNSLQAEKFQLTMEKTKSADGLMLNLLSGYLGADVAAKYVADLPAIMLNDLLRHDGAFGIGVKAVHERVLEILKNSTVGDVALRTAVRDFTRALEVVSEKVAEMNANSAKKNKLEKSDSVKNAQEIARLTQTNREILESIEGPQGLKQQVLAAQKPIVEILGKELIVLLETTLKGRQRDIENYYANKGLKVQFNITKDVLERLLNYGLLTAVQEHVIFDLRPEFKTLEDAQKAGFSTLEEAQAAPKYGEFAPNQSLYGKDAFIRTADRDRPAADLFGRGFSQFLGAVGMELGYDVSAGTGLGKTRMQPLAAAFFVANNKNIPVGELQKKIAIFLESSDPVAKMHDSENLTTWTTLFAALGIELVDGNQMLSGENRDFQALKMKLETTPNAVLLLDVTTRMHLNNNIIDPAGRDLLRYIQKEFSRVILDEAQIAAFSEVKAIIGDGDVKASPETLVKAGLQFINELDRMLQRGEIRWEKDFDTFKRQYDDLNKLTDKGQGQKVFTIVDGRVYMTEALYREMMTLSSKKGGHFLLASELESFVNAMWGEPQIKQLILNNLVDQKPADRNRVNIDMQSSDVPAQIASFYRFLSERGRVNKTLGEDAELRASLEAALKNGDEPKVSMDTSLRDGITWTEPGPKDKNMMPKITDVDFKLLRTWFNVDTIGNMRTLIGSPIQGVFIRGAVALTATMPASIGIWTGNRTLELGRSRPDLLSGLSGADPRVHANLMDAEKPDVAKISQNMLDMLGLKKDVNYTIDADGAIKITGPVNVADQRFGNIMVIAQGDAVRAAAQEAARRVILALDAGFRATNAVIEGGSINISEIVLTTGAKGVSDIAISGKDGRQIVIATERGATGFNLDRAKLETLAKALGVPLDAKQGGAKVFTHVLIFGAEEMPSFLLAQAIGRDRSNQGQVYLYYDPIKLLATLGKALDPVRYDSFRDYLNNVVLKGVENDQAIAQSVFDVATVKDAKTLETYQKRVEEVKGTIALVAELAQAVKLRNGEAAKAIDPSLYFGDGADRAKLASLLTIAAEFQEASQQSKSLRFAVPVILRDKLMMQNLTELMFRTQGVSQDQSSKLQTLISDLEGGKLFDRVMRFSASGQSAQDFLRNEIRMIINDIVGTRLPNGERQEAGSIIGKLVNDMKFDRAVIERLFDRDSLLLVEEGLFERNSPLFKVAEINREAAMPENQGRFSIAYQLTHEGSVLDLVRTVLRFETYILTAYESRSRQGERAERQAVEQSKALNNPDKTFTDMTTPGSAIGGSVSESVQKAILESRTESPRSELKPAETQPATPASAPLGVISTLRPSEYQFVQFVNAMLGGMQTTQNYAGAIAGLQALYSATMDQTFNVTANSSVDDIRVATVAAGKYLLQTGLFSHQNASELADRLIVIGHGMSTENPQPLSHDALVALFTTSHFEAELFRRGFAPEMSPAAYKDLYRREQQDIGRSELREGGAGYLQDAEDKYLRATQYVPKTAGGYLKRLVTPEVWKYQGALLRYGILDENKRAQIKLPMMVVAGLPSVVYGLASLTISGLAALSLGVMVGVVLPLLGIMAVLALSPGLRLSATQVLGDLYTKWARTSPVGENFFGLAEISLKQLKKGLDDPKDTAALMTVLGQLLPKMTDHDRSLIAEHSEVLTKMLGANVVNRLTAAQFLKLVREFDALARQAPALSADQAALARTALFEKTLGRSGEWMKKLAAAANGVQLSNRMKMSAWIEKMTGMGLGARMLDYIKQKGVLPLTDRFFGWRYTALGALLMAVTLGRAGNFFRDRATAAIDQTVKRLKVDADPTRLAFADTLERAKLIDPVATLCVIQKYGENPAELIAQLEKAGVKGSMKFFELKALGHSKLEAGEAGLVSLADLKAATRNRAEFQVILRALDKNIPMISDRLYNELSQETTPNVNFEQVRQMILADRYADSIGVKDGKALSLALSEFEWLDLAALNVLAKTLGLRGLTQNEFDGMLNGLKDVAARKELLKMIALNRQDPTAWRVEAETLLNNALLLGFDTGRLAVFCRAYGLSVNMAHLRSLMQETSDELAGAIAGKSAGTLSSLDSIMTRVAGKLASLAGTLTLDPNADATAYVRNKRMFISKTYIEKINQAALSEKFKRSRGLSPDKISEVNAQVEAAVNGAVRAFMLHETIEAELDDSIKPALLALQESIGAERDLASGQKKTELEAKLEHIKFAINMIDKQGSDSQGQIYRDFVAEYVASNYLRYVKPEVANEIYAGLRMMASYESPLFKEKATFYERIRNSNFKNSDPLIRWSDLSRKTDATFDDYYRVFAEEADYFSRIDVFSWFFSYLQALKNGDIEGAKAIVRAKAVESKGKSFGEERVLLDSEVKQLIDIADSKDPKTEAKRFMKNWAGSLALVMETYIALPVETKGIVKPQSKDEMPNVAPAVVVQSPITAPQTTEQPITAAPPRSEAREVKPEAAVVTPAQLDEVFARAKLRVAASATVPIPVVAYRWALPGDSNVMGNHVAYFNETKNEIVLNPVRFEELPQVEALQDIEVAMVHELVHAANGDEIAAYDATVQAMRQLDAMRYAAKIDILVALLALARGQVAMADDAAKRDVIQLAEQLLISKGDRAQILEALLNRLQSQVYAIGSSPLNSVTGFIPVTSADALRALIERKFRHETTTREHNVFAVSSADAKNPAISVEIKKLKDLGYVVFVFDEAAIRQVFGAKVDPYAAIARLAELAAALGKSQFNKLMAQYEVNPRDNDGFYSVEACFASAVIKAVIAEIASAHAAAVSA